MYSYPSMSTPPLSGSILDAHVNEAFGARRGSARERRGAEDLDVLAKLLPEEDEKLSILDGAEEATGDRDEGAAVGGARRRADLKDLRGPVVREAVLKGVASSVERVHVGGRHVDKGEAAVWRGENRQLGRGHDRLDLERVEDPEDLREDAAKTNVHGVAVPGAEDAHDGAAGDRSFRRADLRDDGRPEIVEAAEEGVGLPVRVDDLDVSHARIAALDFARDAGSIDRTVNHIALDAVDEPRSRRGRSRRRSRR